ncbi:DNA-directed DNA/RNA polymerase mu [Psilocybe cubensis]|uniref:DNA-directed DNA/RNA polymerase mu n=1 Tax=Psilocybe cubensis TaxID=181762 RepID=A0ACB8HCY4_PSICU|nr:DNA-directed DNA/RNA polymerase mu [Psilocybe cubensis]KAH9485502.1 DNA-directed DNA/RNA polymerase mu [Psilocybe cubensis]
MKRSSITRRSLSPSSNSSTASTPRKRPRSRYDDSLSEEEQTPLKVYVLQEKLASNEVDELFHMIESNGASAAGISKTRKLHLELCNNPVAADVIVTKIRMKKRFERHLQWDLARQKCIVTPEWIYDSVKQGKPVQCGCYAAISELHDETVEHCPDSEEGKDDTRGTLHHQISVYSPRHEEQAVKPTHPRVIENWRSKYACTRASPLVCVNQTLVAELGVLGRSRELEGMGINALSYERAVAIREFIKNGYIEEARRTRLSERYQALSEFATVYGIGPSNARKLYDLGLRNMDDLERYYDVTADSTLVTLAASHVTPNGRKIVTKNKVPDMSIQVSLILRNEFEIPISREEVAEMHRIIMLELDKIQPGCVSTVVGGFRRGKPQSNDVDIVFSYPDLEKGPSIIKGLCTRFTKHLYDHGGSYPYLSSFHAHDALRTTHWDSLEKALTVFVLPNPGDEETKRLHRRLDLIFATPEAYWTAVIGWSGSKMFERDLRLWAKAEKGMKFDSSGINRRHDSKLFIPRSEEEVFNILGLDWIDPTMRNADV